MSTPNSGKHCRVCFEPDEDKSYLISPCDCRGTALYIHAHCLDQWQESALQSNAPERATLCPICKSYYKYPSWWFMVYRRCVHVVKFHINVGFAIWSLLWMSLVIIPLKICIHTVLVIITLPFGSFSMFGASLTWIGHDFPPQLAIVHDSNGVQIPELKAGILLVASRAIPQSSMFFKTVVLVLEHSVEGGSKGVVLNCTSRNVNVNGFPVGTGGPMEQETCTVVHNSRTCSRYSYVLNESEGIYVAEWENAYPTIRQLAIFRNKVKAQRSLPAPKVDALLLEALLGVDAVQPHTNAPLAKFADVKVLRGTCVWIPNQLDGEVLAGMWHILPGTPQNLFASAKSTALRSRSWEPNPGQSFYGSHRNRNSANICDTLHWEALIPGVSPPTSTE